MLLKIILNLFFSFFIFFLFTCDKHLTPVIPYVPLVVFSGCFDYNNTGSCTPETLWGSFLNPNKCYFSSDTLNLYFYTKDYSSGSTCSGKMIRFHIFKTDSSYIVTKDAICHISDCATGPSNLSYEVTPKDTINTDFFLRMKINLLSKSINDSIDLSEINIKPHNLSGNMGLTITKGFIRGRIGEKY
jgi:hypothetical protein